MSAQEPEETKPAAEPTPFERAIAFVRACIEPSEFEVQVYRDHVRALVAKLDREILGGGE